MQMLTKHILAIIVFKNIANILETRGPKLTQIKLGITVNNVGDRVILPEK